MVAQQKMKDNLSDTSENAVKPGGVTKSRLSMLKRSSTKQKTSAAANTDPFRFQGNGVDFKGKLIGERDVSEARGDQMCADAMKLVKAAVKSAGAHKQRIILNISIDGLKIRDEKTSIIIHNFPVSKISFIARDTTDARAFGFVFGTADGKYKFYGIKTAQTADHAVLSIRDMFQVVFEMKKKQIEEVKQKKEEQENNENAQKESDIRIENGIRMAELIDLESELEHIAIGFSQLQNIPSMPEDSWPTTSVTPDPFQSTGNNAFLTDPFGSSFNQQQQQQPFGNPQPNNDWPTNAPAFPQQQNFSDSNPFANGFVQSTPKKQESFPMFNPPINQMATVQPQLPADPFDTQGLRKAITAIPTLSTLPLPPAPTPANNPFVNGFGAQPLAPINGLHNSNGSNGFADFSGFDGPPKQEKKVDIDDLFNELMDTNKLMQKAPEQKNPFEHIINPPKPSIVALAAQNACSPFGSATQPQQQLVNATARSDPFNDDFFN